MKSLDEKKQFVEETGVLIEQLGPPPLQSRIIALLALNTPDGVPFEEIVEFLHASKSSISNAINFLLSAKAIIYFTKPGDRKRYFKVPFSSTWLDDFEKKVRGIDTIIELINKFNLFKEGEDLDFEKESSEIKELMRRIKIMAIKEIEKFRIEKNYLKQ